VNVTLILVRISELNDLIPLRIYKDWNDVLQCGVYTAFEFILFDSACLIGLDIHFFPLQISY